MLDTLTARELVFYAVVSALVGYAVFVLILQFVNGDLLDKEDKS